MKTATSHPFSLLTPYQNKFSVRLFTKQEFPAGFTDDQLGYEKVVALHQVHGGDVVYADQPINRDRKADALMTDQLHLCLTIRWADCQNFILYDPVTHTLGAVHAGWRGLLANAIPNTIKAMQLRWSVDPSHLLVCAGPSLCQECATFTDPESELPGVDRHLYESNQVDLRGIADEQLAESGIVPEHIERSSECTRCTPSLYWTYRGGDREAVQNGCTNVVAAVLK